MVNYARWNAKNSSQKSQKYMFTTPYKMAYNGFPDTAVPHFAVFLFFAENKFRILR